ncbi:ATP-binding protein [Streptomyces sp. B-S-A8]|uniref:ATP-binding protein n=1 Tax=Streptomyces solicavernae TaxID=3043614 RepID=A0ABT6RPN3_9ACTN|nr:ATP-binding protein [Streptomyces sp. B-S-A8]MDI3386169.1 ATP-binding protein [Streptomyces sp. B-S-A8]
MNEKAQLPSVREAFYLRERRSVSRARELARRALKDWDLTRRADDVALCVSELATNALLHGVPPGRGYLLRIAARADGAVRVEVHDSGGGEVRSPGAEPEDEGGRGLHLVGALADRWGVGQRVPGKVVWCEFDGDCQWRVARSDV